MRNHPPPGSTPELSFTSASANSSTSAPHPAGDAPEPLPIGDLQVADTTDRLRGAAEGEPVRVVRQEPVGHKSGAETTPPHPSVNRLAVRVKWVGNVRVPLPRYQTPLSAGLDLAAAIDGPLSIAPLARVLVPTGIALAIPPGYEGQVRPRSGLAWSRGVTILNTPGTIDADYRGEIKVLLVNFSTDTAIINPGERIAQLVIARHVQADLEVVESLDETVRGAGGYGSTGY